MARNTADQAAGMTYSAAPAARLLGVTQQYGAVAALDDVSLDIPGERMIGLIGPDGVGKSTMLSLVAGVRKLQTGRIETLGGDMTDTGHRKTCYHRIAYMPQGLGRNLYPTLSVFENLEFFAKLFGQDRRERRARITELLDATGLAPFPDRPAGKLSGGMKQKLGLCCALIHDPDLLILDEPTTGVDPLSRLQFWELIDRIRVRRPSMSVIVATAYMEEAERFDWLAAMDDGRIIATGSPGDIRAKADAPTLEAAFISLLPEHKARRSCSDRRAAKAGIRWRIGYFGVRSDKTVRRLHCRRSCELRDRARRDLRFPWVERLRQDHDDEDADRPASGHRGRGETVRANPQCPGHGDPPARRLCVAILLALRRADSAAEPGAAWPSVPASQRSA